MTACTNKARGAVVAALAGALALGAAPAVALATTGGEVSTLADAGQEVIQGTVTYNGEDGADFSYTGKGQGLVPTSLTTVGSDNAVTPKLLPAKTDRKDGEYYYYYIELGTGTTLSGVTYADKNDKEQPVTGTNVGDTFNDGASKPTDPGEYVVVTCRQDNGALVYVEKAARFTISGQSLDGATIFQGNDVTDTTFNFTGKTMSLYATNFKKEIGIAVDGVAVDMSYFSTNIYEPGTSTPYTGQLNPGETYVFAAQGRAGTPYAGKRLETNFTVEALDLADSTIVGQAVTTQPSSTSTFSQVVDTFNGYDLSEIAASVSTNETTVKFISGPDGTGSTVGNKKGEYTFRLVANDNAKYLVPGSSKEFTVLYGDYTASVTYGGDAFKSSYLVDLSKGESFDLSKIKVTANGDELDADDYDVTVTNAAGDEVSDLSAPGTYTVDVYVNWKNENGKWYVAHESAEVTVSYGDLQKATDVFMSFDGKNVDNATDTNDSAEYTGEDLSERMSFTVKAGDTILAEGTDYTVSIQKQQADGKWADVDSVVDAGDYRVTVKGLTYTVNGSKDVTFYFEVTPMKLDGVKITNGVQSGNVIYLTGDGNVAPTPTFEFYKGDNKVELPEGAFDVTYDSYGLDAAGTSLTTLVERDVELKDLGGYKASFEATDEGANYSFAGLEPSIIVTEKGVFLDVPANEWYSQAVYTAKKLGYMNGDGGQLTFSPTRELTRAEAVCVLFNMAGGDKVYSNSSLPSYNPDNDVYETGFSDVAGNEFYAKAIAWAKATGVVNGYADGTFGVSRNVTSEEFACMLANYAKAKGEDVAVEDADAVLAGYADASTVSDWAKEAVAWAVESGVMGNSAELAPSGSILRMRVAAMVVNYQPEGAADQVIK